MAQVGIEWIKDTYAPLNGPSRAATVIEQMRHAGFFPLTDRPEFVSGSQSVGTGPLDAGTELEMSAPLGTIYYTLDGSDPWVEFPTLDDTELIGSDSTVRVFVPRDGRTPFRLAVRRFRRFRLAQRPKCCRLRQRRQAQFADRLRHP